MRIRVRVFIISDNLEDLFQFSNQVANDIYKWTLCNKLTINLDKTNYMIFKLNSKDLNTITKNRYHVSINNHILHKVNCVKYLGLLVDDNLTWSDHISKLCKKLRSFIGIFYRKRYAISMQCRRNLYFALIHSSLLYCIEIYGLAQGRFNHGPNRAVARGPRPIRGAPKDQNRGPQKKMMRFFHFLNDFED